MLNLNTNSVINYPLNNSSNFKLILSFYHTKSHVFKTPKNLGFPKFFFSATCTWVSRFCPKLETLVLRVN